MSIFFAIYLDFYRSIPSITQTWVFLYFITSTNINEHHMFMAAITAKRITVITIPIYLSLFIGDLTLLMAYGIANTPGPVVLLIKAIENYYKSFPRFLLEKEKDRRIHQPVEIH